ncbi:MAG TPA: hypothetical protein VJC39_02915 [Candidatus Nanoarchaeia archaeon]|nr:hypothetical protein [Candidatus Nanoarchaeia archaeon]
MFDQDKIIDFLKATGPTLPAKVARNINTDILLASAHLSDLSSRNKLKISSLKIGGSPLYYLPGQEDQLYQFAAGNINPKDFAVLEQIREQKVLREEGLSLLAKVALRSLKDFAVPLQVSSNGKVELFWKWHLLSSEETNKFIGKILTAGEESSNQEAVDTAATSPTSQNIFLSTLPVKLEVHKSGILKVDSNLSPDQKLNSEINGAGEVIKAGIKKDSKLASKLDVKRQEIKREKLEKMPEQVAGKEDKSDTVSVINPEIKISDPKIKLGRSSKLNKLKKADFIGPKEEQIKLEEPNAEKTNPELPAELLSEKKSEEKPNKNDNNSNNNLTGKKPGRKPIADKFLPLIEGYFKELSIDIKTKETIRKHGELDLLVSVPTAVGSVTYFCKAKNKSRCDEKDVSSAYMEAMIKKLPLLFLYTNNLTPKAKEMLKSEAFSNTIVKKIKNE